MDRKQLHLVTWIAAAGLLAACDGGGGTTSVILKAVQAATNSQPTKVIEVPGDPSTIKATRDLSNCTDAKKVSDISSQITEASGAAHFDIPALGLANGIDVITAMDHLNPTDDPSQRAIFVSTDGMATVEKLRTVFKDGTDYDLGADVADMEAIAVAQVDGHTYILAFDGGANRNLGTGLVSSYVERNLSVFDGDKIVDGYLTLLGKAFVKLPVNLIDQGGVVQQALDLRNYAAAAVNPINLALYFLNSMASDVGMADSKQLVSSLIFKIDQATWMGIANSGQTDLATMGSVNAEFVANLYHEYNIAQMIRNQGATAVDRLINILPTGMQAKATQVLRTRDLTQTRPQDIEDVSTLNTSGMTLEDLFISMFGDGSETALALTAGDISSYNRDPVSRDILKLMITDMQFGATGRNFYVQTYGGPMMYDIDLTSDFPAVGEIVAFGRARSVPGAILLRQMESLGVVTTVAADGSEQVELRYTSEDSAIDFPNGTHISALGLAPALQMTCHREPLGAALQ